MNLLCACGVLAHLVVWIFDASACFCRGKMKLLTRRLPRPKRKLRQRVKGGEGAKGDKRKEAARGGRWEMRMSTQQQALVFKGVARARGNRRAMASSCRGSWHWGFRGNARKC